MTCDTKQISDLGLLKTKKVPEKLNFLPSASHRQRENLSIFLVL